MRAIFVILATLVITAGIIAEPVSEKAKEKRYEDLHDLAYLQVPIANFGTEDMNTQYDDLKSKYEVALAFYFEDDYLEAYRGFIDVQKGLEKLYEDMSLAYIDRTSNLLQASISSVVELELDYHPSSKKIVDMLKAREAPKEKPMYDPQEYHYVYDKFPILKNIDRGYEYLGEAKRLRKDALNLEKWLEEGKELDPRLRKRRIENYKAAIELSRNAKTNGVRVFQLMRRNDIYSVQIEHKDNYFAQHTSEEHLSPVLDPRIPDDFKIDATDVLNRVYEEEVRVKLNNENIEGSQAAKNEQ